MFRSYSENETPGSKKAGVSATSYVNVLGMEVEEVEAVEDEEAAELELLVVEVIEVKIGVEDEV